MLPIVAAPLVIKNFCSLFETIFERPEQQNNFESIITALCVSKNKTIAGLHQQLFTGVTYNSLHHFMSESPWSVEKLQEQRIKYVKERIGKIKNYDSPLRFSIDECSVEQAKIHNGSLVTQDGKISECVSMPVDNADEECEPQKRKTIVQDSSELSTNIRSVDSGTYRLSIEPRKLSRTRRRLCLTEQNATSETSLMRDEEEPCVVGDREEKQTAAQPSSSCSYVLHNRIGFIHGGILRRSATVFT